MKFSMGVFCDIQVRSGYISIGRDGLRSVFSNKVKRIVEFEYMCSGDDADFFQLRWLDLDGNSHAGRVKVGFTTRSIQVVHEKELEHED